MKYLRLTARPPPEVAPRMFELLASSEHADAARAVALNVGGPSDVTALFRVEGDHETLRDRLADAPEVVAVESAPTPDGGGYLLLSLNPNAVPLMATVFGAIARERLVFVPPLTYGDGGVHARLVGNAGTVADLVDTMPPAVDLEIHEVGEQGLALDSAGETLSDRQREAVLAALELGYYEQPREGTHEDVAAELGCAPSTASEHLQKAEAKLVAATMADET